MTRQRHAFAFAGFILCIASTSAWLGCSGGSDCKCIADAGIDAAADASVDAAVIDARPEASMEAGGVDDGSVDAVLDLALEGKPVLTPEEVVASLNGLRWELPCSNNFNGYCDTPDAQTKETHLTGTPGAQYDVTLRFRGVIEEKTYDGGSADDHWYTGGGPAVDLYNVYQLEISNPPQLYYLNNGTSTNGYCEPIDYMKTVRLAADATVTLVADPIDGAQVANSDDMGMPVVIPAIPPAPLSYDGQFIQMDVVLVKKVP